MNYRTCWLTLNRACNLRCKWCYARGTEYQAKDDMDFSLAKELISLCASLDIHHATLIGGEPTIYPHLFEVIDACREKGIRLGIVTNGLACADSLFVKKLKERGINSISLSLKGENEKVFEDITGVDAFAKTCEAISLCLSNEINVSVSMVLTEENIDTFLEGVKRMKKLGVKHFHFSFCYEFDTGAQHSVYLQTHNPTKLIKDFMNHYDELDALTEGCFSLQEGFALCLWEEKDLAKLNKKKQVSTICQLLAKSGLIFDPEGYLIPCNAMHQIKLGKFGEDFHTKEELCRYMDSPEMKKVYAKLCGVPDKKCLDCKKLSCCAGGCVCQWTNYSFLDLERLKAINI